jgi:hypothetical protein
MPCTFFCFLIHNCPFLHIYSNLHVNTPSFLAVGSILRAATSLQFTEFRRWAVTYLERMWPKVLYDDIATPLPHATLAITLAEEYDVPNISKRAYYEILRTPGFIQTLEINEQDENDIDASRRALGYNNYALSATQLRHLTRVRERLTRFWVLRAATPPPSPCVDRTCPSKVLRHWATKVHISGLIIRYIYDPICGMDALAKIDWSDSGLDCDNCVDAMTKVWANHRQILWNTLNQWLAV